MNTSRYYQYIFPGTIAFSVVLMLIGLSMGHPEQLLSGLWKIVTMQDLLITDYIHIAGPAAAFVNAGLVTIISILIIKLAKDPFNGFTIVEMGLMAGFSLFGKNVFNIWPIILGTWLYARYQREPFSKYCNVAMMATALSPLVSFMTLSWERVDRAWPGTGVGRPPPHHLYLSASDFAFPHRLRNLQSLSPVRRNGPLRRRTVGLDHRPRGNPILGGGPDPLYLGK